MKRRPALLAKLCIGIVTAVLIPTLMTAQTPGLPRQVLTIDEAVRMAVEQNINISLSHSRVETAGAHVTSSFGTFLPQINVSAGYNRQLSSPDVQYYQGIPITGATPPDNYTARADASVLLFDGFSRTSSYSAAQSNFNATVQDLTRVRQDITFQTRAAFLNALRAEQLIEVRQSDLDVARERLARVRGMVEAGAAQAGQIYSEEATIANEELSLEQARTDALVAKNNLAALLNIDPRTELQLSSQSLATSIDSTELLEARRALGSADELYQKQTAGRADIQAAQLRVDAADASITAARAGYYPSISAGLGWSWNRVGATENNPSNSSANTQFGLSLQYTPFDGFRTSEQVQIAESQRLTAQLELRKLELDIRSGLQQSLARLEGAERQLRAAEKAVAASRQSRFAADERYRVGVGNYADYLLANAQYLTAQVNQVNAVFNYRMAIYEVRYHVGE